MNLTGKKAVPFQLRDINDKTRTLEDYAGDWLLLVFHRHLG
jgi:peroxiredoxin